MTKAQETWPLVKVMTHSLVIDNNYLKYIIQMGQELMSFGPDKM